MARPNQHEACVIMISGRYFYEFGQIGQCLTAWSLAGAQVYMHEGAMCGAMKKLELIGKKPKIVKIGAVHAS